MSIVLALSKILAGIGFFLLGMRYVEESMRNLTGRSFKLFLRHQTTNKFKAITGGALVTAVLQSSSIVNLMVLAFVGAGILTLRNALAIMLGANLGTTLSSWAVALLGFSFNIEFFSLPLVGLGGIGLVLLSKSSRAYHWSKFVLGLGALFVGLDFMKASFGAMAALFDFQNLQHLPAIFFVLVGFLISSLIQSSSATVAITLSALNVDAINLYSATAVVLGSEVGTTIKLLLAAVRGVPAKKRVALGNFLYNTILLIIVFIALKPINQWLAAVLNPDSPLVALVFFQSFVNIAGIIIFFPFLNLFEKFLLRWFSHDQTVVRYLKLVPAGEGDLALDGLDKEAKRFIRLILHYHLRAFHISGYPAPEPTNRDLSATYEFLKMLHGEIHTYYIGLNKELLNVAERERTEQIISSVRNSMFSAKSIKDSTGDIEQLRNSSSTTKFHAYQNTRQSVEDLHNRFTSCLTGESASDIYETIVALYQHIQEGYGQELQKLYRMERNEMLTDVDISTLINFNREIFAAYKAMLWSVKDYLLNKEQARYFAELPGFIR
jgi:phosphate:Na+ symporter